MARSDPRERTSLIVTVLNEAASIDGLLQSIEVQTRAPDEIVIVDGGSTDGTWEALQRWSGRLALRTLRAEGANIATGRNLAIASATADLLVVTDAGVRLEPTWLERLLTGLDDEVDVVGGFFKADPCTTFERAMGATVLPALEDISPRKFLPSSRSVLVRRRAWQAVGGYPEWLDYCEDLVLDLALKEAGFRFAFAPDAVAWFRPRGTVGAFFRQYYRYARGDGKANLWPGRHLVRYVTYGIMALTLLRRGPWLALLPLGGLAYTRRPYQRLELQSLSATQRIFAVALVPVIRIIGDMAKMLGYPVGVAWGIRHSTEPWTCRSSS